jgi:hypothetical protein
MHPAAKEQRAARKPHIDILKATPTPLLSKPAQLKVQAAFHYIADFGIVTQDGAMAKV